MKSRFEVMAQWNMEEISKAEDQLERARRIESHSPAEAQVERQEAMARLESVRDQMHKPAPDHILEAMGFNPADFDALEEGEEGRWRDIRRQPVGDHRCRRYVLRSADGREERGFWSGQSWCLGDPRSVFPRQDLGFEPIAWRWADISDQANHYPAAMADLN